MKRGNRSLAMVLTVAFIAASGAVSTANASGFAVYTQGASSLGQGNSVTAHVDDPSAIFYNPALITKLEGTQVQGGTTMIRTSRRFRSSTSDFSPDAKSNFPSTFYVTSKLTDNLSVGLGVFNPFGLKTEWGNSWEGRFITTKSELTTYNVNPVVAYRITPALSVAAGVEMVFVDATLERLIPPTALGPGSPLTTSKFEGDGTGVGFNVAVAYDISPRVHVGASYRSEVEVDLDGDSSTSPGFAPLNVSGHAELTLPQQVTAGIAYQVTEPLIVELGLRWEGWSSFDQLAITLNSPVPALRSNVSRRDWSDALSGTLGAKYRLTPTVALLGGYVYGGTPVPSTTFDPTIPDAVTHIFSAGTDLNFKKLRVALAYAYQMLDERTKSNTIPPTLPAALRANGKYNTDAHLLGVSLGYAF